MADKSIKEYDNRGNLIYNRISEGIEYWWEYDKDNRNIYFRNSYGHENWKEYDKEYRFIHYKEVNGEESWWKTNRNEDNKYYNITEKEFNEIKFRKREREFLNRKYISRFNLMDI